MFNKILFVFILYLNSLFLLIPQKAFSQGIGDYKEEYSRLISTYKRWSRLEREIFERLTFRLSSSQLVRRGEHLKLTLEDNLGRKWIFKTSGYYERIEAAIIVYHLYKLFGLESPEIHPITLNINGKKVSGSIQIFVPNRSTLNYYSPDQLSPNCLNYLIRTYVLNWLLANYDAHSSNFLVLSFEKEGRVGRIARIDNDAAFIFLGQDSLKWDYVIPWYEDHLVNYYSRLWKAYMSNHINLDLEGNYVFVKFVSNFPDSFFERLILPIRTHNFQESSDYRFRELREKHSDFLEPIILRKRNLIKDFEEFYRDLVTARNESLTFPKNIDYQEIATQINKSLIESIEDLKRKELQLRRVAASFPISKIEAIVSFEGFEFLDEVYWKYWEGEGKDLIAACNYALEELFLLESSSATNKYEKAALKCYIEEIKKIRSGEKPSYSYDEINKVVDSILPES
jgi:hypothetical protein